MPVEILD